VRFRLYPLGFWARRIGVPDVPSASASPRRPGTPAPEPGLLASITSHGELKRFVRLHPNESPDLEYKPLWNVSTCNGSCTYCGPAKGREKEEIRYALGRTAVAFANASGGWLVIGAERYDPAQGLHRLETHPCGRHSYTPEEVQQAIDVWTIPAVTHSTRVFASPEGVPTFVVRVDAAMKLHGFRGPAGHEIRIRRGLESPNARVDEIELQVLAKEQIAYNQRFREEVRHSCMELLNAVLCTVGARHQTPAQLAASRSLDFTSQPGSGQTATDWLLAQKAHETGYRIPREFAYFIRHLAALYSTMHGRLDVSEAKLLAECRAYAQQEEYSQELSPVFDATERAEDNLKDQITSILTSEGQSYSDAFDEVVGTTGTRFLDEHDKRTGLYHLADAIVRLVPPAIDAIRFYERIKAAYGSQAISETGVEY
jgi:hypothetical protein